MCTFVSFPPAQLVYVYNIRFVSSRAVGICVYCVQNAANCVAGSAGAGGANGGFSGTSNAGGTQSVGCGPFEWPDQPGGGGISQVAVGGSGGGLLTVIANETATTAVQIDGVISLNGAVGVTSCSGSGGGGSGGVCVCVCVCVFVLF